MEIRNLESFIQVAELGSFTKAAESLGYTQSSVSTQIRQLENELGIPLFERINHSVKLTERARKYFPLPISCFVLPTLLKKLQTILSPFPGISGLPLPPLCATGCSSIISNSFISFFPKSLWS